MLKKKNQRKAFQISSENTKKIKANSLNNREKVYFHTRTKKSLFYKNMHRKQGRQT